MNFTFISILFIYFIEFSLQISVINSDRAALNDVMKGFGLPTTTTCNATTNKVGVVCDSVGSVTGLFFDQRKLSGTLSNSILKLSSIDNISLYNCGLSGTIPNNILAMKSLGKINIGSNNFSGTIPAAPPSSCESLYYVSLFKNTLLTGDVTNWVRVTGNHCLKLQQLHLGRTKLIGFLRFPTTPRGGMRKFHMTHTALQGTIPSNIDEIWPNLIELVIGANFLSGTLPPAIGRMTALTDLHLINNNLTGDVSFLNTVPLERCFLGGDASTTNTKGCPRNDFCCDNEPSVCVDGCAPRSAPKHASFECNVCATGLDSECDDNDVCTRDECIGYAGESVKRRCLNEPIDNCPATSTPSPVSTPTTALATTPSSSSSKTLVVRSTLNMPSSSLTTLKNNIHSTSTHISLSSGDSNQSPTLSQSFGTNTNHPDFATNSSSIEETFPWWAIGVAIGVVCCCLLLLLLAMVLRRRNASTHSADNTTHSFSTTPIPNQYESIDLSVQPQYASPQFVLPQTHGYSSPRSDASTNDGDTVAPLTTYSPLPCVDSSAEALQYEPLELKTGNASDNYLR